MRTPQDSPVEKVRKTLPKGDGNWKGFDHVYSKIQTACHNLAKNKYCRCSNEHVYYMAVLGCGNEELMKYEMLILTSRGLC